MTKHIKNFLRLTRFRVVFLDSFILLSIVGIFASWTFSFSIVFALITNLLILLFAFAINDVEDSEDDALDPAKVDRNPVSSGDIKKSYAYKICATIIVIALLSSFPLGGTAFVFTMTGLFVGFLYSWKMVRLKSYPVLDVVSHAFALASVQIIIFGSLSNYKLDKTFLAILVGVFFVSVGGSFYNQYRDYEVDRKVRLKNTASLMKKGMVLKLSYLFYTCGIILCLIGVTGRFLSL